MIYYNAVLKPFQELQIYSSREQTEFSINLGFNVYL